MTASGFRRWPAAGPLVLLAGACLAACSPPSPPPPPAESLAVQAAPASADRVHAGTAAAPDAAGEDAAGEDADTLTAIAATSAQCARAVSARMRRVCSSDELRRLHWAHREHFALLRERFPDDARSVQLAAERQLEACPDEACLRDAYRDWETYLGENYDLFDAY